MPKADKNTNKNRQHQDPDDVDDLEGGGDEQAPSNTGDTVRSALERIFSSGNFRSVAYQEIRALEQKNNRLLRRNRELRSHVEELETAKPADDAVVLAKDDAAEWAAFKKLNVKAADLAATIDEHGKLKAKETERSEEEQHEDAAEALGFENVAAFTRWLNREKLHLEFRDDRIKDEETGRTVTVKTPIVRSKADEKAALEPLAGYIEREVPDMIVLFESPPIDESDDEDESELATAGADRVPRRQLHHTPRTVSGTNGVRMPVTRNVRPSTGAARSEKAIQQQTDQKRAAGGYSL